MCASFSDIDECANPRDVCPYLTECINTVGSYICDCKEAGFKADGKQCLGTLCIKYQSNKILHVVIGPGKHPPTRKRPQTTFGAVSP